MSSTLDVAVDVDVSFDRAKQVLRSDLVCWLPPAVAGSSPGGWATSVRNGVLRISLETIVGGTWIGGDEVLSRHVVLAPRRDGASDLSGTLATGLTPTVEGRLLVEPQADAARLRFLGRLHTRNPLRRRFAAAAVRQLLRDIADRLPTAPTGPEDAAGGRAATMVRCSVTRPG